MNPHQRKHIRVFDTASPYLFDEYLTETEDIEEFRRHLAPWTQIIELSESEYEKLRHSGNVLEERFFRCFARCLSHEGISVYSLDQEAIERIMRDVADIIRTGSPARPNEIPND